MVLQLTAIVLRSWSEAVFLPVLAVRCRAEWCDEAVVASLWGMVVPGLAGLDLGGLVVAVRHLRYLVQIRKLPTLRVSNLTENHVGQLIQLQGQVASRSPVAGPLSQRQVVAFALEVKGKWRRQGLDRGKTKTRTRKEQEYIAALLDDGTGQVDLHLEKRLIYWRSIRATWRPEQAPEWIFLPKFSDNEYNLVEVSATERHVPHGAHVYVLGKLSDTGRLAAKIVGVGTARMTQQALLVDILL